MKKQQTKKQKIKKTIISWLIILVVLYGLTITYLYFVQKWIIWPYSILYYKNLEDNSEDAKYLTKSYPTDIAVYGDTVYQAGKLPIRYLEQLNDSELGNDDSFYCRALVINDRKDQLNLSEDEIQFIVDKVVGGWSLFYYGTKYLTTFADKIGIKDFSPSGDEKFLGVWIYPNGAISELYGCFSRKDELETTSEEDAEWRLKSSLITAIKSEIRERIKLEDFLNNQ